MPPWTPAFPTWPAQHQRAQISGIAIRAAYQPLSCHTRGSPPHSPPPPPATTLHGSSTTPANPDQLIHSDSAQLMVTVKLQYLLDIAQTTAARLGAQQAFSQLTSRNLRFPTVAVMSWLIRRQALPESRSQPQHLKYHSAQGDEQKRFGYSHLEDRSLQVLYQQSRTCAWQSWNRPQRSHDGHLMATGTACSEG